MKIVITSVLVDDQDKALRFYTKILGFVKKTEIPMGTTAGSRWSRHKILMGLSCSSSRTATRR